MLNNSTLIKNCPLCESNRIVYDFVINANPVCSCIDCSHLFINPQPINTFDAGDKLIDPERFKLLIQSELKPDSNRILEIGTPMLEINDYELTTINGSDNILSYIEKKPQNEIKYDCCILNNTLEYSNSPYALLRKVHESLKKNGLLLFYIPVTDSKAAKTYKYRWPGFSSGSLHFFSTATIQNILCKCGFEQIKIRTADDNGVLVSCKTGILRDEKFISIIIPVYNEEKTVGTLLNSIINKQLEGLKKEIIIVESNSKDTTRQIVENFAKEHPEVKLILEEEPHGKGHAVRNGFKEATGDFIAIQDGDLEYDINDYDQLVIPLRNYQKAFVLGSRHKGDWKIREFDDKKKGKAIFMNLGHIFFTSLINVGCKVKLKDPFTMYKLFRRDCLNGLKFDGNRFEIDWEIIIKFIRKGYIPEEIPINYNSRGFEEGKKVSIIIDPLIWIKCFIRYRYFYKIGDDNK
jgi:hypothetical protein